MPGSDPAYSAFTRHYQASFAEHLARISRPGGLFEDAAVTGSRWRGQIRRVRAVLYRRLKPSGKLPPAIEVEAALNDVAVKWTAALAAAGIRARRGTGEDLYTWLLPWLNPRPEVAGGDPARLLEFAPYPGDEALPFGYDLAECLTLATPRSDNASATWWLDGLPHTIVTVQGLRRAPEIGHLTAERSSGDHLFALFDRCPEHTILAMTLTVRPQDLTRNHIAQVRRAAVGDSAEAALTREDADAVEREMEALFRSVPPPLTLVLAMTEKHEKAERAEIMRERGCSELEAATVVAERLAARGDS